MTRGTVHPPDTRIRSLESSNAVLRRELYSQRNDWWRGLWFGALVVSPVSAFVVGLAWRALEWWFA
jgi:hypothetical protein